MSHQILQPDEIGHEEEAPPGSRWRRPILITVASLTAAALILVPVYNVIDAGRPVADSGLELCGFDYCVVQDAAIAAGLNEEMSRLANTFLSDGEARRLAGILLDHLGQSDVDLVVVDRLSGDLKGQYDPHTRIIRLERPVRAWIVVHEVAHTVAPGHGEDFQNSLIDLTRWLEQHRAPSG